MALGSLMLVTGSSRGHDAVAGAAPLLGLAAAILWQRWRSPRSPPLARTLAGHIHPLQAVSFGFAVGAVLLAAIVVLSGRAEPGATFRAVTALKPMLVLVYLGTVPTALAYICYFYRMQLSRTATSGVAATLVEPAVAVLLAAGLLGEYLSPAAWLGVACLLFATILLGLESSPAKPATSTTPDATV